jgi:hypothetical protein
MSYLQEPNKPFYDDRTTSDLWHRESERHGMERDRQELRERCGNGYVYDFMPPRADIPPQGQSYEEFWAETVADRETWWPKWKKEHGL